MGLYTWTLSNMLTPKFWKLIKRDGFLWTYLRGHKQTRNDQYIGGHEGALKPVGEDEYGNKYYEDFAVDHRNNIRYVEFADHYTMLKTGDIIPPKWDGWLKQNYVEPPSDKHFVNHFYIKDHKPLYNNHPKSHCPPGYTNVYNQRDP